MTGVPKFPEGAIELMEAYADAYLSNCSAAALLIDRTQVAAGADLIRKTISDGRTIYVCGNGGSGSIASHLLCDFAKGIQTDTALRPRVVDLAANTPLILAIGNDISFSEIFRYQVQSWARRGDLLLTISSSGNSENIVHALHWAKDNDVATLALTGFDGGRAKTIADICVHVPAYNYGVVEDLHQSIMHIFAQFLRQKHMSPDLIRARKF